MEFVIKPSAFFHFDLNEFSCSSFSLHHHYHNRPSSSSSSSAVQRQSGDFYYKISHFNYTGVFHAS